MFIVKLHNENFKEWRKINEVRICVVIRTQKRTGRTGRGSAVRLIHKMGVGVCVDSPHALFSRFSRKIIKKRSFDNMLKYDESYIGKRYNYFIVQGFEYNERNERCFKCLCDCGNVKLCLPINVVQGIVKSCGCMKRELNRNASLKHGACTYGCPEKLYRIYRAMIERCYNPNHKSYINYGGRGIGICEEWRNDYGAFRDWAINQGYDESKGYIEQSIDRKDNNKGYCPENCRLATAKEQRANQRKHKKHKRNSMISINEEIRPKRDVCKEYGISVETFDYRVKRKGMSVLEALTTPKMATGRPSVAS